MSSSPVRLLARRALAATTFRAATARPTFVRPAALSPAWRPSAQVNWQLRRGMAATAQGDALPPEALVASTITEDEIEHAAGASPICHSAVYLWGFS